MSVFAFEDYRHVLRDFVEREKSAGRNITYAKFASAIGVQKSYLSQTLSGRCDLNSDQLFRAAKYMQLNEDEQDYLQLLLEHSRTRIMERKTILAERIGALRTTDIEGVS